MSKRNHLPAKSGVNKENRTLDMLKEIQAGRVDPKSITPEDRVQLVNYLLADGYSTAEMAEILKVSERTIERDRQAIRETNALERDPRLVAQTVGHLVSEAGLAIQRIRKAARDKSVSPTVKVDAEHRCYQITSDFIQRLQSLGYLPMAAQRLEADLTHHVDEVPDLATLHKEAARLKQIKGQNDPRVAYLEMTLAQAGAAQIIAEISSESENKGDENDDSTK